MNITWNDEEDFCRVDGQLCTPEFLLEFVGIDDLLHQSTECVYETDFIIYLKDPTNLLNIFKAIANYSKPHGWKLNDLVQFDEIDKISIKSFGEFLEKYPNFNKEKHDRLLQAIENSY